jgi:hypothetical protein
MKNVVRVIRRRAAPPLPPLSRKGEGEDIKRKVANRFSTKVRSLTAAWRVSATCSLFEYR